MSFCRTDIRALAESIKATEPVITESVMEQLVETLQKLQAKVCETNAKRYYKYKTLQTHLLPLTNIAFDKLGKRYSRLRLFRAFISPLNFILPFIDSVIVGFTKRSFKQKMLWYFR